MVICVFEDEKWHNFAPLTYSRPVALLRAGIQPVVEQIKAQFDPAVVCLAVRDQLAAAVSGANRDTPVNIIRRNNSPLLFINGRLRNVGNLAELVKQSRFSTVFLTRAGEAAALLLKSEDLADAPEVGTPMDYQALVDAKSREIPPAETNATLYGYLWEFIEDIDRAVTADFARLEPSFPLPENVRVHDGAHVIGRDRVFLGFNTELLPGSVIDASTGPVYLADNARVEPHAAILGPCYIGPNSVVLAGKLTGSSIGHTCRVGGEVEESIFQGYVNKYHAGFIGHSYVGEWVNFGAMTTNSDLKNNYSTIRVTLENQSYDTGSIKVGSFIGDHSKFGIGTLLTTGITIGVSCNIFGGSLVTDRVVPSFSWGTTGRYDKYDLTRAIDTARRVAGRRDCELSPGEITLLETIFRDELSDRGVMRFPTS